MNPRTCRWVAAVMLVVMVGCNPVSALINNTNYTLNLPLGLNGSAGLLNPLAFVTLIFANLTNLLGLGTISGGIVQLPGGGGS